MATHAQTATGQLVDGQLLAGALVGNYGGAIPVESYSYPWAQVPVGALCGNQFPKLAVVAAYSGSPVTIGSNNMDWAQIPKRGVCGWQFLAGQLLIGGPIVPTPPITVVVGGGGYYYSRYDKRYDKLEDIFKDMSAEDDNLITLTLWTLKYLWRILP